jgi:thymidylate synthase ThyX
MAFAASILADSVSPRGHRLTTLEVTFPRIVLAEFNTHRVFSRNSASSRAIPVVKQIARILEDPYVPGEFGANQPGMQAAAPLTGAKHAAAREEWLRARDHAAAHVLRLVAHPGVCGPDAGVEELRAAVAGLAGQPVGADWLNVHKQLANRLLEPFMWHTLIVSATEWSNFFHLRAHPDAQPEIREVAELMRAVVAGSAPRELGEDEWHLPLMFETDTDLSEEERVKVSVGRCARVSYLTHDGRRDPAADLTLHDRLLESGHLSPFEHVARPEPRGEWCGNFHGWRQYRKDLPAEADPLGGLSAAVAVS